MRRLYVYYRVREGDLGAVVAAVKALQLELRAAHPGLEAELLRRPAADAGLVTLMEVYGGTPELDGGLAQAIERRAAALLAPYLDGVRHVEVFESLAEG